MKILKITGVVFLVLLMAVVLTCSIISEDLPKGVKGVEAEALTDKMWENLNKTAWDTTRYVSWSFRGEHHYKWDKAANLAEVSWDNKRVLLDPNKVDGIAYLEGEQVDDRGIIDEAWSHWCNDMFWLIAPFKVRDAGTSLSMTEDRKLIVTYESGGVTPGDSYVWELDENGRPYSYDMYVSVIPVQGASSTWEGWQQIDTGAWIATVHEIGGLGSLSLKPLKGGMNLSDIDLSEDIWAPIR